MHDVFAFSAEIKKERVSEVETLVKGNFSFPLKKNPEKYTKDPFPRVL